MQSELPYKFLFFFAEPLTQNLVCLPVATLVIEQ